MKTTQSVSQIFFAASALSLAKKNRSRLCSIICIGGDEKEWLKGGKPQVVLDNLYAEKKIR